MTDQFGVLGAGKRSRELTGQPESKRICYELLRPTVAHEAIAELVRVALVKEVISSNVSHAFDAIYSAECKVWWFAQNDGLHLLSGLPLAQLHEVMCTIALHTL